MSERYQRATDILELKDLLQTTLVGLTMDDISENFEVSRRTAERMIGALRDRFPGLRAETRDGRKYWSLATSEETQPSGLPADLEALSKHIDSSDEGVRQPRPMQMAFQDGADDLLINSAVGIFLLDVDFKVVWISRAMERYFGIDRANVIGRDKRKLIRELIRNHLEDPLHFEERVLATYENNAYIEHFRCHVLPGEGREERWLEHWSQPINAGPFAGGRVEHYIDVTQNVLGEDVRRHELRALRSRFQSAGESPNAEEVASAIARAIVNPLSKILEIVNNPEVQGPGTVRADAFEEISGLATRIGESIDKMLELTKSERLVFESLKAKSILVPAVQRILPIAAQLGGDVEVTVSPNLEVFEFEADPNLLGCALDELLKNAVEEMPDGGTLLLTADLDEESEQICFSVSDHGPKIGDESRTRPIESSSGTRRGAKGLNLGVSRSVADLHGGELEIDVAISGRSKVILKIPVERR